MDAGTMAAAESIDKLVTLEMRVQGLPSGVMNRLNVAATEALGEIPVLAAAQALLADVEEGDTVAIVTGAGGPPWLPHGETDGPQGAVGLAHGLALAANAKPILVTEERSIAPLRAAARACGLNVVPFDQLQERDHAVTVVPYTEEAADAQSAAENFLETYEPTALLAVEKIGPNREEVIHSITGHDFTEDHAKMGPLFDLATEAGVLTIGIGDGGNEIGFGKIEDAVREIQPYGDTCQCPCQSGVATRIACDYVVVGGTSNWGAYGIEALLALLTETPEAMHGPDRETRMLEFSIMEGSNDGLYARPIMKVDGTTEETQRGMVSMLGNIVENRLLEFHREF